MKPIGAMVFLASSYAVAAEDMLVVGEVVDPDATQIEVKVCGAEQIVPLGIMASNQYVGFMSKVNEASESGSVLVQVRGEWDGRTLERMHIIRVGNGACSDAGT